MMYWQTPMIDRWIEHELLRAAFAEVFRLDPARIQVTDDALALIGLPIPSEPRILLECFRREGHFPLQLDVVLVGDELEQPVADLAGTLDKARALARRLNAVLLFGTGPIGYSEQLRVAPDGTVDVVQLDGDALDEDRFVVVGARPFVEQPAESAPARAG
jgi:hypothetical protein